MNKTSQLILRIHAIFLMILTVALTVAGFVGLSMGVGPFSWVQEIPMVLVGLMQAYLLMFLVGVSMWFGAGGQQISRWSVVAIAAHCVPLLAIVSLWNVLADAGYLGIANYSYVIHGTWITIEVISLVISARQGGQSNTASLSSHV